MSIKPFLSVVVPVYNENQRIHNLVTISNYLKAQKYLSELIVVNDGSTDNSLSKLRNYRKKFSLKIFLKIVNLKSFYFN